MKLFPYQEVTILAIMLPKVSSHFFTKLAHVIICIIGVGFLIMAGKTVFCPLVFSFLFAILLLPVAAYFEQKLRLKRGLAAALSVLLLLCVIAIIFYLIGSQVNDLTGNWPAFKEQLSRSLSILQRWGITKFNVNVTEKINKAAANMNFDPKVIGITLLSVSSIVLFIVFIVFETFFILFYRRLLLDFLVLVVNKEDQRVVYDIVKQVQITLRRYLIGLLFEMVIVTTTCCLSFWAIGIKYPFLLGLITGLFNIIPYLGIFTALLISVVITFSTVAASKVILLIVVVIIMHLIDSNILLPFVVGSNVRINALVTIVGLAIGAMIWQVPGMFLSIPVLAIFKIIFDRIDNLKPFGILLGDNKPPAPH